jgi:hypothetical protein
MSTCHIICLSKIQEQEAVEEQRCEILQNKKPCSKLSAVAPVLFLL